MKSDPFLPVDICELIFERREEIAIHMAKKMGFRRSYGS